MSGLIYGASPYTLVRFGGGKSLPDSSLTAEQINKIGKVKTRPGSRLYKNMKINKPKYKIGDIVLYEERGRDDGDTMKVIIQSTILEAYGYTDEAIKDDNIEWYYATEETRRTKDDNLVEVEILCSL
jgi:hypothetical protein